MPIITFTATFAGGAGTLSIVINGVPIINFVGSGQQNVDLQSGTYNYIVSGAAANGPGGGATLLISGPCINNSPHHYGPGLIPPNAHPITVF